MRRTRSRIRAAEIAALAAEQDAHERRVSDAVKVAAFARYQLGEGIEKKEEDFAAEVAKTMGAAKS